MMTTFTLGALFIWMLRWCTGPGWIAPGWAAGAVLVAMCWGMALHERADATPHDGMSNAVRDRQLDDGDQDDTREPAATEDDEPSPEVELLRKLETKHAAVETLSSDITYQIWDAVLERTETRSGRLAYDVGDVSTPDDAGRRFAVEFDTLVIGRTRREEVRRYVFSGSWLAEFNYDSRMYIRRQVVPPDETFDPLKLGEGPFPMPFAQEADAVLDRFDVELIGPPTEGLLADRLGDIVGMALLPKPDTPAAEELHRVELYYDKATLLPVGIVAIAAEEVGFDESRGTRNRTTVWLRNPKADAPVDESLLAIDAPDGWDVQVTTWRDRAAGE